VATEYEMFRIVHIAPSTDASVIAACCRVTPVRLHVAARKLAANSPGTIRAGGPYMYGAILIRSFDPLRLA
jgi:hypothetical protein